MSRKRIFALFAVAVTALGLIVGLMPASNMAVSNADVLGNGYDVSCTKANDNQVVCKIGGCPRVYENYAGDMVHTRVNSQPQHEIGKSCGATITQTVDTSAGFNYAVQGCRDRNLGDKCGAWSDYTYVPPAAPAAPAPARPRLRRRRRHRRPSSVQTVPSSRSPTPAQ